MSDALRLAAPAAPAGTAPVRPAPGRRPMAPAKLRILQTADTLFTHEGIRGVGVDRLISESRVTKATFYKHYGSKDRLIVEYVRYRHAEVLRITEERTDPAERIRGVVDDAIAEIEADGFRGDAFLNAAAEFPQPGHAVRSAVRDHREWLAGCVEDALRELRHPLPGDAADELLLARDGAMSGAYAGDPIAATTALRRVLDRTLAA